MDDKNNGQNIFDGVHLNPQFAIALKNFIYANPSTNSALCRAHAASTQSIADVTNTKVVIDSADIAGLNLTFDSVNNRFTCLAPGNYVATGSVVYNTVTDNKLYIAKIFKNGSQYSQNYFVPGGTGPTSPALSVVISDLVNLVIGDYVELYTFHNSGLSESLASGSWFAIAKV